eukprot:3588589-Rhodomonas_salina.6
MRRRIGLARTGKDTRIGCTVLSWGMLVQGSHCVDRGGTVLASAESDRECGYLRPYRGIPKPPPLCSV